MTPHSVPATTELMLQHTHPDDLAPAVEVLEKAITDGLPFSSYHRIIDAKNRVRSVLFVGRGVEGPAGKVEEVIGFFVDLTAVRRAETQAEVESALVQIAQTRPVIDQAKGMVMLATGCDAEERVRHPAEVLLPQEREAQRARWPAGGRGRRPNPIPRATPVARR